MSLNVHISPGKIAPCVKNPVVFGIQSNSYIETAGVKAVFDITFTGSCHDLDSFMLTWNEKSFMFTCKAAPAYPGEFPLIGSESFDDWIAKVAKYFFMVYEVSRDFAITIHGTGNIRFSARTNGIANNISFSSLSISNASFALVVHGVDEVRYENYRVGLQVCTYGQTTSDINVLVEETSSPDANGLAMFDISEVVESQLHTDMHYPEDATIVVPRPNVNMPYFIRCYECWGNPAKFEYVSTLPIFFALNGGIPPWKQFEFYRDNTSFNSYMTDNGRFFLTWLNEKKADFVSPEKLYVIIANELSDVEVTFQPVLRYADGTFDVRSPVMINSHAKFGDVYELMVGYHALDLVNLVDTSKPLVAWEVHLYFTDHQGSLEKGFFRFNLDPRDYAYPRYFLFKNSLGVFECARFIGEGEQEADVTRLYFENFKLAPFDKMYREAGEKLTQYKEHKKVNTGWISKAEMEWLKEMLISEVVYEVNGLRQFPINIVSEKMELSNDNSYLYMLSFEYEYMYMERIYQPIIARVFDPVDVIPPKER